MIKGVDIIKQYVHDIIESCEDYKKPVWEVWWPCV